MTEPRRFGKYSKVIRNLEDTIQTLCQQMERIVAGKDAEIEQLKMEKPMTDEQIKYMVDRFLMWKLPRDTFNPDCGISFDKKPYNAHTPHPALYEPSGTNLFDAQQAEAMVRYMAEGMPEFQGTERDRCERTLRDIMDLSDNNNHQDAVVAILERLERHWGREADDAAHSR